jgi:hypothetical protein
MIELGLAMITMLFLNIGFTVMQLSKYVPGWQELETEEMMAELLRSAPMNIIQMLAFLSQMNILLLVGGLILVIVG